MAGTFAYLLIVLGNPGYMHTLGKLLSAYPVQHAQVVPHRHQCVGCNCPARCHCRHANARKGRVPAAEQACHIKRSTSTGHSLPSMP